MVNYINGNDCNNNNSHSHNNHHLRFNHSHNINNDEQWIIKRKIIIMIIITIMMMLNDDDDDNDAECWMMMMMMTMMDAGYTWRREKRRIRNRCFMGSQKYLKKFSLLYRTKPPVSGGFPLLFFQFIFFINSTKTHMLLDGMESLFQVTFLHFNKNCQTNMLIYSKSIMKAISMGILYHLPK